MSTIQPNQNCLDVLGCPCCGGQGATSFCKVSSICKDDPLLQTILIPAIIALILIILLLIVCCKLRNQNQQTMKVKNFARQEMYVFRHSDVSNPSIPSGGCQPLPVSSDGLSFCLLIAYPSVF